MKKLIFLATLVAIVFGVMHFLGLGTTVTPTQPIEIPKGAGVSKIAEILKDNDLIRSRLLFQAVAWIHGATNKLQAGEYKFPAGLSLKEMINKLAKGEGARSDQELRILEGWTIQNIATALEQVAIPSTDFYALVGTPTTVARKSSSALSSWAKEFPLVGEKPAAATLEGYLFPDTYRIFKDATAEDVIQKMLTQFEEKITSELRTKIKESGRPFYDVLRVASIVEAEIPHAQDRPIIAGIVWKRLDVRMALQVDSTLNYITHKGHSALTSEDLAIDSLYNTYKYRGLPPTPINNPGLNAIQAAINPEDSLFWYWLSSKEGTTIFSKTLDEHNTAKAKYLK